jgi:hypothetical protein
MSYKTTLIQTSQSGAGTNVLKNKTDPDITARGRDCNIVTDNKNL